MDDEVGKNWGNVFSEEEDEDEEEGVESDEDEVMLLFKFGLFFVDVGKELEVIDFGVWL